jgi:hypothetical protein
MTQPPSHQMSTTSLTLLPLNAFTNLILLNFVCLSAVYYIYNFLFANVLQYWSLSLVAAWHIPSKDRKVAPLNRKRGVWDVAHW